MPEPRAQTMRGQQIVNRVMRTLLRVPVLNRAAGRRLIVIDVVGRRTGRHFEVPVAYTREGADLLIGSPFGWGRNLRTGHPVTVLLQGARRTADVTAYTDQQNVTELYAEMCRDNKQFAKFNKIALDSKGEPDPTDLELAWQSGARAFRLTPRGSADPRNAG